MSSWIIGTSAIAKRLGVTRSAAIYLIQYGRLAVETVGGVTRARPGDVDDLRDDLQTSRWTPQGGLDL